MTKDMATRYTSRLADSAAMQAARGFEGGGGRTAASRGAAAVRWSRTSRANVGTAMSQDAGPAWGFAAGLGLAVALAVVLKR